MLTSEQLIRQSEIIPARVLDTPITVIGAGAIGSFVVLSLAKMGFNRIEVWDFDEVSDANMSCQWFRVKDIGLPKVQALQSLIRDFTELTIEIQEEKYEGQKPLEGIVISSVDSMRARKTIWQSVLKSPEVTYLIDPRMAAEYALSFVIDPKLERDRKAYESTLYTDSNSVEERCTAKATMYTATMLAGYVAKHVKDIVTGTPYARTTQWNIGTNVLQNWMRADLV